MKKSIIKLPSHETKKMIVSAKIASRAAPAYQVVTNTIIPSQRQLNPSNHDSKPYKGRTMIPNDEQSCLMSSPSDSSSQNLDSLPSCPSSSSCEEIADEFENLLKITQPDRVKRVTLNSDLNFEMDSTEIFNSEIFQTSYRKHTKFQEKINDLMMKFGFKNKEVIIEEEDPAMIQLTTQMSSDQGIGERILTPVIRLQESMSCKYFFRIPGQMRNSVVIKTSSLKISSRPTPSPLRRSILPSTRSILQLQLKREEKPLRKACRSVTRTRNLYVSKISWR